MSENMRFNKSGAIWALGFAFFVRHIVFWYLMFALQRLLFVFHYWSKFKEQDFSAIFKAFYFGCRVDLATIGYVSLTILPFFLVWMSLRHKTNARWIVRLPLYAVVLFSAFVHSGEIAVYYEWGHKLTSRVFTHLVNPGELVRTAAILDVIWFVFYSTIQLVAAYFLIRMVFKPLILFTNRVKLKSWFYPLHFLTLAPLSLLMARGGWQPIAINISAAMFSQSTIINDLSTNSTYYFLQSAAKQNDTALDKVFEGVDLASAQGFRDSLHTNCDGYDLFLDTIRPNLVFVVLESWVADAISYSGKIENSTPNFDDLIGEGVYFSNCYATSGTSEVGNASIFSGYPALPGVSLTLNQDKSRNVLAINQTLKPYGYSSSYLFGGDLKYGNIGAYFLDHQFDDVKDESYFSHVKIRGKLNVYDTDLFDEFIKQLNDRKEPFLSVAFTGSTHSPWDIPAEWNHFYAGNEAGIVNTIRFADYALALFIEQAKKQPWFDNTLFVFVADHGRTCPSNASHLAPEFFRIPLLFWGKPIKEEFRGANIDRISSQSDLLATLLGQMQISAQDYPYSRNQMCSNILPFAIYTSTLGYGGVSPECHFYINMAKKDFFINSCDTTNSSGLVQHVQWYLKTVWEDFKAL